MALFGRQYGTPAGMGEIPYGFKNLWAIQVSTYNLDARSFRAADITGIVLNGMNVSLDQLLQLYDYNRDGCGLEEPGLSGLYATLTGIDSI